MTRKDTSTGEAVVAMGGCLLLVLIILAAESFLAYVCIKAAEYFGYPWYFGVLAFFIISALLGAARQASK